MKSFQVSMGKGAKNMRKKMEQMLKDMPTVTLIHPGKLLDRLQVQNSRQSRFKRYRHRQPHSHHSDVEGQDPQKQIPPLHTIITSRIHHTRAHTQRSHVHCSVELCIKYIIHGRQGTVEWEKLHMPITVCVRMFCVWVCVYKHVSNQIPLSPAVALWDSIPPTPNRVGSVLLSQWHRAGESCAPHWSPA